MNRLKGSVWRLTDVVSRDQSGHQMSPSLGPCPMGIFEFGANRVIGAIGDGSPPVGGGQPALSYFSYTGPYRLEGDLLIVETDAASTPTLLSTQTRKIRFEGDDRMVLSPHPQAGSVITELGWERLK